MFAIFVYGMTKNLNSVAAEFDADATFLEQAANAPIEQVTDFEP